MSNPPKRKRSAQPGNSNALKHGLYSARLDRSSPDEYSSFSVGPSLDEILALKVSISRHLKMRQEHPATDPEETRTDLRVLSFAAARLASLLRLCHGLPVDDLVSSENWLEELIEHMNDEGNFSVQGLE